MNVGSLFSGIGGMDAGLARAGLEHAFLCEGGGDPDGTREERQQWSSGKWRRGVLAERFPGVPIYDDVRSVGREHAQSAEGSRVELRPGGDIHLLCGGFPCQDLSVAGRRAGLTGGERSSLFFEFARVADELVPAGGWILIENVPGLLSSQDGRDFALILATLAELGFHDLAWRILDSRYFGVPQRRRRVFILGRRARGRGAFDVLLEPESSSRDPQTSSEAGQGVAGTLGGGSGSRGWAQDVERMTFVPDTLSATLKAQRGKGGGGIGPEETLVAARTLTKGERYDGDTETFVVADTLTSGSHPGSNMPGRRREDDTNIVTAFHQTQEPIHGDDWSPALGRTSIGMGVNENAGVRRLTPVECERLQGLPDGWTQVPATAPDSRRYAALGDAVTANVAHWIGLRLLSYVQGTQR